MSSYENDMIGSGTAAALHLIMAALVWFEGGDSVGQRKIKLHTFINLLVICTAHKCYHK